MNRWIDMGGLRKILKHMEFQTVSYIAYVQTENKRNRETNRCMSKQTDKLRYGYIRRGKEKQWRKAKTWVNVTEQMRGGEGWWKRGRHEERGRINPSPCPWAINQSQHYLALLHQTPVARSSACDEALVPQGAAQMHTHIHVHTSTDWQLVCVGVYPLVFTKF